MSAFAIAQLRKIRMGADIEAYLRGIDVTLAPYGGRFRVHGAPLERREGAWPEGDLVLIEFASLAHARGWYASSEYQALVPLRTRNSEGDVVIV